MQFSKQEKQFVSASLAVAAIVLLTLPAQAMHIMEGYLPLMHSLLWSAATLPFVALGVLSIKKTIAEKPRALLLLAMMGAFTFLLSALKIPSVTGSSSHPTGTGLGAILFGPLVMSVLGMIVLLFQAILLAHGGLTTLGANTFSMAVAGPFVSFWLYRILTRCKVSRAVSIGVACALGDLVTYCMTSVQLGIAHPDAVGGAGAATLKFLGVFAVTQVPLAIIEGALSAAVILLLEQIARPELREIGFIKEATVAG